MKMRAWVAAAAAGLILAGCRPSDGRPTASADSASAPSAASAGAAPSAPAAEAAQTLPDFRVKTLDGGTAALSSTRGKVVILDLFATWCPPCRMEIPQFVALQKQYADRLTVVGLSYDQGSPETVKKFMAQMQINYPVYWGSQEIAEFVGLRGIPHTLVLDAQGRVQRSYVGYTPKETFEQDVLALSAAAGARP